MDLQWSLSPAPVEPSEVIAVFRPSTPEGAEKKVAKGHKLEFVRWLDIGLTNGRAALYRIMDGRPPAEVLAALKGDPHVSTAQRNKRYRHIDQVDSIEGKGGSGNSRRSRPF